MPHVVCLRPVHPEALALLRASPGVTVEVLDPVNAETIAAAMPKADAVIVRATPINREFLAHAPNLRIVARHGVGYDAVDVPALTERGIPLTVTPDANAACVAEHAMMLMLNVARQTQYYDAAVRELRWSNPPVPATFDLGGKTVLVMGFGRIGGRGGGGPEGLPTKGGGGGPPPPPHTTQEGAPSPPPHPPRGAPPTP